MGLFSHKTDDTKARIEELKKKIQAEQQAYGAATREQPRAPAAPVPPPEPAPVQEVVVEERAPVQVAAPVYEQPAPVHQPRQSMPESRPREHISFHEARPPAPRAQEQINDAGHGIVLDLGEGMSLNVPVKSRMNLDEFLGVADKVRELQRLQRPGAR